MLLRIPFSELLPLANGGESRAAAGVTAGALITVMAQVRVHTRRVSQTLTELGDINNNSIGASCDLANAVLPFQFYYV